MRRTGDETRKLDGSSQRTAVLPVQIIPKDIERRTLLGVVNSEVDLHDGRFETALAADRVVNWGAGWGQCRKVLTE